MRRKVTILGAGYVGSTIAYTLAVSTTASEVVLIDINKDKAKGEALDIIQGTAFYEPVLVYDGEFADAVNSDIVIVAMGLARKPGQTRLDLAQTNVDIVKDVIPKVFQYAPNAVYLVVTNPVDVLTYTLIKACGIPEAQVIGSGTVLDSARLRHVLGTRLHINYNAINAYVLGEHGDSSVIPWSIIRVMGIDLNTGYDLISDVPGFDLDAERGGIEAMVRNAGATVIALKGSTHYAVALSVKQICEAIYNDLTHCLPLSAMLHGQYGIEDVCLSLPFVIGINGIRRPIVPILAPKEEDQMRNSAQVLKGLIASLDI